MMPVPAPPRPGSPDQSSVLAPYTPPSERNAAAITSLICAILWPLSLFGYLLWNAITHFAPMPDWISTFTGFFLIVLPPVGIISGVLGLVRSFTRPLLRPTRWQAIVGLIFCLMWLAFTLLDWL